MSNISRAIETQKPVIMTSVPGPQSRVLWEQDKKTIGPGLQAVVLWSELAFARGSGPFVEDVDGNVYVDFMGGSGVNNVGHSHPHFVKRVTEQVSQLMIGGFASQSRVEMLSLFKKILPPQLDRIQFYSGGTESVEAALRLAKSYTGKQEFLSFWNGYHGKSLGALALTDGAKKGYGPSVAGTLSAPYADCYRCAFKLKPETCKFACADHVAEVIKHESTGSLAAIIVEPIQGRMGNITPPKGFLTRLKQIAVDHGALLIVDETMSSIARTGRMFDFMHEDVVPDIVIFGKGMSGGYPVTGIVSTSEIMEKGPFAEPSASSSSFGAFPAACAALQSTIEIILDEKLCEKSEQLGGELLLMLEKMAREVPMVGAVRGRGLMLGLEIVEDKRTMRPASKAVLKQVFQKLLQNGILVMMGGNSVRLYPALTIEPAVARNAVSIMHDVLTQLSRELGISN